MWGPIEQLTLKLDLMRTSFFSVKGLAPCLHHWAQAWIFQVFHGDFFFKPVLRSVVWGSLSSKCVAA